MAGVSRREAIALPAGLAALYALEAPAKAAVLSPPSPDRELLALCRRFMSLERRVVRLMTAEFAAAREGDNDWSRRLAYAQSRRLAYSQRLMSEVMELRATTPAGLRAKAEVLATRIQYDTDADPAWEYLGVWSVCRDLLGYEPTEGTSGDVQ